VARKSTDNKFPRDNERRGNRYQQKKISTGKAPGPDGVPDLVIKQISAYKPEVKQPVQLMPKRKRVPDRMEGF